MKYDGLDVRIRDVQKVQMEILLELDRICKKNHIKYQLFAGTLLGAIRHKGFIPWDDDIDVCLLRSDYKKFIECCKSDLNKKYFLQDCNSDEKAILQFAKIRKNNTIFTNKVYQNTGTHNGIYIDVFPLDNIMPDKFIGKVQPRLFNLLYMINSSRIKGRAINTRTKLNMLIRLLLHYISKLIPKKSIDQLTQSVLCMFENKEVEYITHMTNGASQRNYYKYMMKKDEFYNTIDGEFEGHNFPIPRNYDEVLTKLFGDYMTPPSLEAQKPHHGIIEVSFNTNFDK